MKLGLKGNEVKVVPYTPEWHSEFLRIQKEISKSINIEEKRIEHIGSTAIKDMLAKPIIGLLVGVDKLEELDLSIINGLKQTDFLINDKRNNLIKLVLKGKKRCLEFC